METKNLLITISDILFIQIIKDVKRIDTFKYYKKFHN